MKQVLVSVIVPVYKAEVYLHRCVDSLLSQTMKDFEILLIDDGSPDKSGVICDEYASKDDRIRVFHKENGGVASARQLGIENVKGEYTIHADPDDWVEPTMLEELYSKAKKENADMVICDYYEDVCGRIEIKKLNLSNLDPHFLLKKLLQQELHGSTCNKLIRSSCYNRYNVRFPDNIIRWEDLFVICNFLIYPIKIVYLDRAFYHYDLMINSNSIVRKPTIQGLMSQIYFCDYFSKNLDNKKFGDDLYQSKKSTKELAWVSQLLSDKEIIDLYPEINERYLSEKNISPLHVGLSIFLRGHSRLGRCVFICYGFISKIVSKLYRIVK